MQRSCYSSNLSCSQSITSFKRFDSFLRLFALSLLELGCWLWIVVVNTRESVSFAGAGRGEGRDRENAGLETLVLLEVRQLAKKEGELSVALVVGVVVAATGVAVVGLTCGCACQYCSCSHGGFPRAPSASLERTIDDAEGDREWDMLTYRS